MIAAAPPWQGTRRASAREPDAATYDASAARGAGPEAEPLTQPHLHLAPRPLRAAEPSIVRSACRAVGLGAPLAGLPRCSAPLAGPTSPPPPRPQADPPDRAGHRLAAAGAAPRGRDRDRPPGPPGRGRERTAGDSPRARCPAIGRRARSPAAAIDGDAQVTGDLAGPEVSPVQSGVERPLVGDAGRRAAALLADEADAGTRAGASAAVPSPNEGSPLVGGRGNHGRQVVPGAVPGSGPAGSGATGPRPSPRLSPRPDVAVMQASTAPRGSPSVGPRRRRRSGPALSSPPRPRPRPPLRPARRPTHAVRAARRGGSLRGAESLRPGFGVPAARRRGRATAGGLAPTPGPGQPVPTPGRKPSAPPRRRRPRIAGWPRKAGRAARRSPRGRPLAGLATAQDTAGERLAARRLADGGIRRHPRPASLGWSAGGGFAALPAVPAAVVQRARGGRGGHPGRSLPPPARPRAGTGGAGTGGAGQD